MISLILPYWDRVGVADAALERLAQCYPDLGLQVIVVDDGNPTPYKVPESLAGRLQVDVVRLPEKREPKSPVTCWNAGFGAAKRDLIGISCVEVWHSRPVLKAMAVELDELGPRGYVLAAAWCPELREWHCHSQHAAAGSYQLPKGTGRAFLGLMHRSLYEKAGGWDEDYRDGAGYEDVDFIHRMLKAGAEFRIRDDLVVNHPKTGASIAWGAEKFARNAEILKRKWAHA